MFKLVLTNDIEDFDIFFKVRKTNIAKKWYNELCKNYPIHEDNRFTNWKDSTPVLQINKTIKKINQYQKVIDVDCYTKITQQDLNYLHKFFEDLRGDITTGTPWFNDAPAQIKSAVEELNILIHQLESELRTKNHPTVVVTFKNRNIYELTNNDLKYFTHRWTKGTVYINYCQIGKTVLDVFKDNDAISQGIRPQQYYSADFMIKFGPTIPYPAYLIRNFLITQWAKYKKFNFKNFNIGMIPVADCIQKINNHELKKYNRVKAVVCLK